MTYIIISVTGDFSAERVHFVVNTYVIVILDQGNPTFKKKKNNNNYIQGCDMSHDFSGN